MRSRFVLGWMLSAFILAIFIPLLATENVLIISVAMQLVFYVALPVLLFSYHFKKRGVKLRQVVFFRGTARWLLPIFGLTVLMLALSMSLYWMTLRAIMPITPTVVNFALTPQPLPKALWYLVATGFILAIIAPIAEEFVFRGLILNRLMAAFGFWNGLGLSSLLFAIFHINFFGAFLFAVVASLLYLKTGNLLVPILLHIANNLVAVYQSFINPTFPQWLMVTSISDLYTKSVPNFIVLIGSLALLLFVIERLAQGLENKIEEYRIFWK
ncbi:type II CAAX endopeptidase family protein [Planococcus sp. ISL-109]|uniref:CPBP family intramembrane glutamic endopeptidase n=1 Tax=Planococcus sp. ISL-109 TaxID=2819166 RepID=UPI001BE52AEF|nr:type II CAAX endopeptidase family protein [Planococcus sp. ISL-109]MBT2582985.1 CPBP family intramembrane metalloprotease [Planococcus sp. ISL-109]